MKKEKDLIDGAFFHIILTLLVLFLILTMTSCKKEVVPATEPELVLPQTSMSLKVGVGKASLVSRDANGYWHVPILRNANNNYFSIFVEATAIRDAEKYPGLGYCLAQSDFVSDAFWTFGGAVRVVLPTASRFARGIYSNGRIQPIINGTYTVTTYNFTGQEVFVVPPSSIYLKDYNPIMDQYKPAPSNLWSNRICGPILGSMYGDTITVYAKTFWAMEGINNTNAERATKYDSVKVILKP